MCCPPYLAFNFEFNFQSLFFDPKVNAFALMVMALASFAVITSTSPSGSARLPIWPACSIGEQLPITITNDWLNFKLHLAYPVNSGSWTREGLSTRTARHSLSINMAGHSSDKVAGFFPGETSSPSVVSPRSPPCFSALICRMSWSTPSRLRLWRSSSLLFATASKLRRSTPIK